MSWLTDVFHVAVGVFCTACSGVAVFYVSGIVMSPNALALLGSPHGRNEENLITHQRFIILGCVCVGGGRLLRSGFADLRHLQAFDLWITICVKFTV